MATPTPRPGILDIAPYVPGGAKAPGADKIYKLSSNVIRSRRQRARRSTPTEKVAEDLHLYPDGGAGALCVKKFAALHELDPNRIVCGAGSDEILQLLTRAYLGPGDNIIQTDHGFLVYALAAKSCGGEVRFAPEKNLTADIDEILKLVDDKTRLVFIANPNNPTGTYVSNSEIRRLHEGLPSDVILVIDAAYAEYMEEADYDAGAKLVDEYENVVMTRTFSKIYGLGGIRLGWGYFPAAIADVINRIRGPFNVNAPSIAAGVAALDDQTFVTRNRDFNRDERNFLAQQIGGMGLTFVPSFGNFILVKFPDEPGRNANDIQTYLRDGGVIVREMGAYKLGEWLRISVGTKEGNRKLVELLQEKFGK